MRRLLVVLLFAFPALAAGPKVEELKWMAGHWSATTMDGVAMEEVWLAPKGGLMTSTHRDVRADGKVSFEFARIAETKDGVVFFAQPNGQPPTPFPLLQISRNRVIFANPQHDFPQRIIYWLRDGNLCARVEGTIGGKSQSEVWCWSRH
jgi:hypothetical protein